MLLHAQKGLEGKQLQAYRLPPKTEFKFDGVVDEEFWNKIEPATGFKQQMPREGDKASERTEVRIVYDDEYLYMGIILYDSNPSGIKAYQYRRDAKIMDDRFAWIFDTYDDQRNAYYMEVNPNGLRTDGLITIGQGSDLDLNWDGIWDAKTQISDLGWSIEVRIPLSTLNFDEKNNRWGINFLRNIPRKNETVVWSGYRRNQGVRRPQNAGALAGLSNLSQGVGLEVVPYITTKGSEEKISDTNELELNNNLLDGGFDINYSITPSLKASVTYNTDFAEAEVDERKINFTRFSIKYEEQRDFFLEGANIYKFAPSSNVHPYFSRRIGLREGNPVPITYGARILGNVGEYNMALLHVRTGEKSSIQPEEFTVARIKRNIGPESTIGAIYTLRSSQDSDKLSPAILDRHTFGADLELSTSTFLRNKNLQFQAFFVYNTPAFTDVNKNDFWDRTSRGIRLNYPNQPYKAHVSYREFGSAFDPAVGFASRNDFRRLQPSVGYTPQFKQSDLIQQIGWELYFEHLTDMDFKLLTQEISLTLFDIEFMSGDNVNFDLSRSFERLKEPFDLRNDGSVIVPINKYTTWASELGIQTASHRRVSLELSFETGGFWTGHSAELNAEMAIRPFVGIKLSPEYIRTNVNIDEGKFSTDLFRFSTIIDLSPYIFFTTKIQYDNLSKLLGVNNRFRWIIKPGSDLYLVYNHKWTENRMQRFKTMERSGIIKVGYTYRF